MGRRLFGTSVFALVALCAASWTNVASAGWWTYQQPRTALYVPQTAYYAPQVAQYPAQTAYYAPQTAYYGAQTAYSPVASACGTCTKQVCSYVPQTAYQTMYRDVPVTSYHPVTSVDHCSGCSWTSYRPVTQCVRQAYYVPYTTYRQVCSNVTVAMQPVCAAPACATAAYVAQPAAQWPQASGTPATAQVVAPAAATAPSSCCGGSAAAPSAAPTVPTMPGATTPGSPLPTPAVDPTTPIPQANGAALGNPQTREAAKPQVFPRATDSRAQPTLAPKAGEPQDRVASAPLVGRTIYTPVTWTSGQAGAIRPASAPAVRPATPSEGWTAE